MVPVRRSRLLPESLERRKSPVQRVHSYPKDRHQGKKTLVVEKQEVGETQVSQKRNKMIMQNGYKSYSGRV